MNAEPSAISREYYQALVDKNVAYEGTFIAAVKTTGIFCRPTCTARKPKPENVEFFACTKDALLHGYRACKVCRPLEKMGETPSYIQVLLRELHADLSTKFTDGELRARGLEPATLRRWFLKNHGLTFHAYQRLVRLNGAFKRIQRGESVTATAFEAGYESLSGFQDSFKAVFGVAPSNSRQQQVIDLTRLETPLGTMLACGVAQGICLLEFTDRKMLETELKDLAKRLNAAIVPGYNPHFDVLQQQLDDYFRGERQEFSIPLFTPGTPFQQAVWQALHRGRTIVGTENNGSANLSPGFGSAWICGGRGVSQNDRMPAEFASSLFSGLQKPGYLRSLQAHRKDLIPCPVSVGEAAIRALPAV